jgi:SAM-dependent methyltransferase
MPSPLSRGKPDPRAALEQYRRRADSYDSELLLFEPIRTDAIEALELRSGDTVLDVGCGTGLSFELLEERVGDGGRVVGIEQCPEMMAKARQRVHRHDWHNTDLVCAPAASADVPALADAALFHFTHDVLRDLEAIANILSHLKPGAHVVASGLQWAPPWAWPMNGFVLLAAMYSVTSFEGLGHPWDKLAQRLTNVRVQTKLGGGIYIASGVYAPTVH